MEISALQLAPSSPLTIHKMAKKKQILLINITFIYFLEYSANLLPTGKMAFC